jgi:two-component system, OmpR family, alkaline phosphatase synthesis response regulator PhoP
MEEKKQTILIIEDDYEIRRLLETVLSKNGFIVSSYETGENALKRIPAIKPSLIILDIQLPKMNGLEFCKKIRSEPATKEIPIIILSAFSSETYKITGLETGADDFITKPFSVGELLARIKAILRRTHKDMARTKQVVEKASVKIDLENRTVSLAGKALELTPKEFILLSIFMQSDGKVVSRDTLSAQVWEREYLSSSRTIDIHIARLRKKLGNIGKSIKTVAKVGYRFLPET